MAQFDALDISEKDLAPIGRDVIVTDMVFDERITSSGIVLLNDNGKTTGIRARWGRVYAVGPLQNEVKVGDWVCVSHGRWTRGILVQDGEVQRVIRKVDPADMLMVSDEMPQDDSWAGSNIAHG